MYHTQRRFLPSGCSPRRQQRSVAEGSPPGEPIGHALVVVRHKRRRRAVTYCQVRLRALRGPAGAPSAVRRWGSRAEVKVRGGVDARASSTTSNEEIGRDPRRPKGLRRHGPAFVVAAPRRWSDIAVVAAPRIRGHVARNGRRWGLRPGLLVENTTGHGTSPPSLRDLMNNAGCLPTDR